MRTTYNHILFFVWAVVSLCSIFPGVALGQEIHNDLEEILTVEITDVVSVTERELLGTDDTVRVQTLTAKITSGDRSGDFITFENELALLGEGDRAYINHVRTIDGTEYYIFKDYQRTGELGLLFVLFVAVILLFMGWHGGKALLSLGLSVAAILFLLVPMLLAGFNPALSSFVVAGVVLALVIFLTHGFRPHTVIAFFGTFSTIMVTCLLAWWAVDIMRFSGLSSDISIYLKFSSTETLDFAGLLLGGIIIGILGVLDDVSITQTAVVRELKLANPSLSFVELYTRAIRVGRSHIGSLVNTLAFAYVGVSLPLIMLFAAAESDVVLSLNQEMVASELVRIIVGSIGLILAVPLTTLIASWWYEERHEPDHEGECGAAVHHHVH